MLSSKGKIRSNYRGRKFLVPLSKLISPTFLFVLKCSVLFPVTQTGPFFAASGLCPHCFLFLERASLALTGSPPLLLLLESPPNYMCQSGCLTSTPDSMVPESQDFILFQVLGA